MNPIGPIVVDGDELRVIAAAVRANFIHSDIVARQLDQMLERGKADTMLADAIAELKRLPCRSKNCEHCRVIKTYESRVSP